MDLITDQDPNLYHDFSKSLITETRFFCEHPLLKALKDRFSNYTIVIDTDVSLYRARRMNRDEFWKQLAEFYNPIIEDTPFQGFNKVDSFVPPIKDCRANRANTSGISCLYVASSVQTAIAEVRPFKNTFVSVAEIKLKKPLTLFKFYYDDEDSKLSRLSLKKKYPCWYISFTENFSKPFENSVNDEYLVTQCVSEYIRRSGIFDGLSYSSSLDDGGKNIVIFNCEHNDFSICEPVNSKLYSVENIKIISKPVDGYTTISALQQDRPRYRDNAFPPISVTTQSDG
jgi:hypothetical protein